VIGRKASRKKMKLIKFLIFVITLFILISAIEPSPRIAAIGSYLNVFREKKKRQELVKKKEAEYKKKLQSRRQ
jgi:hypothetical protein